MEHGVEARVAGGREGRGGHWGHSGQRPGAEFSRPGGRGKQPRQYSFDHRERHSSALQLHHLREWAVDGGGPPKIGALRSVW